MSRPAPLQWPHTPRHAIVFSGHRIDAPDRAAERFPARHEATAARRIEAALDALDAGPPDLALTQGAAGGDLLFAEACLRRGVALHLLLPLPEPAFLAASVRPSDDGARWEARYRRVVASLETPPHVLPPVAGDPYAACNRWLLDSAFASGAGQVTLVCLWDGEAGDGPGGTADMVDAARRAGGRIAWIDTRSL